MSLLTTVLEMCLSVQWKEQYEVVLDPAAPPVSVEDSQQAQEALKILFNITHSTHTQEPEEVCVCRHNHTHAHSPTLQTMVLCDVSDSSTVVIL